ncbi:MAG: hypothetical protein EXR51_09615 [Dehalococcoidia bacterium]|nr:hypothetical protein [Dehalococcoidia bacterium]
MSRGAVNQALQLAELLLLGHYPDRRAEALALDFATGEFRAMKMAPSLERALQADGKVGGIVQTSRFNVGGECVAARVLLIVAATHASQLRYVDDLPGSRTHRRVRSEQEAESAGRGDTGRARENSGWRGAVEGKAGLKSALTTNGGTTRYFRTSNLELGVLPNLRDSERIMGSPG